jgi:hypothetical protein
VYRALRGALAASTPPTHGVGRVGRGIQTWRRTSFRVTNTAAAPAASPVLVTQTS